MTGRRIVSIFLPRFAIQRWQRRNGIDPLQHDEPTVLARDGRHGPIIHDMNAAAHALGMQRGARITDMRALVPKLRIERADLPADATDLTALSHWCRRWCPWVQTDGTDGLLLDTTGTQHLFGGEQAMLVDMTRGFAKIGLTTSLAVAPTIGAAFALSHYGKAKQAVCLPGDVPAMLATLPPEALRLDEDTVVLLRRLGLKTISDVAAVPRTAMVRRFRQASALSSNPVMRLDQAMGQLSEPLVAVEREPRPRALRRLAEPIAHIEPVGHVLTDLLDDLCQQLGERDIGARRLSLTGYRVDGGISAVNASTSRPSRDSRHLHRLFDGKLEMLEAGFGFETLTLEAIEHQEMPGVQQQLTHSVDDDIALSCLADRLIARFGSGAVRKALSQASHIPERAETFMPIAAASPIETPDLSDGDFPLRLLSPPETAEVLYGLPEGPPARFRWRKQDHIVTRSQGPQRIAPEWWREKSTVRLRDYYRVEDSHGRRFWIYREGLPDDGRGGAPRWFVHGLDA